jgi:hypothetical protein
VRSALSCRAERMASANQPVLPIDVAEFPSAAGSLFARSHRSATQSFSLA